jgi:hypothetical protein
LIPAEAKLVTQRTSDITLNPETINRKSLGSEYNPVIIKVNKISPEQALLESGKLKHEIDELKESMKSKKYI